MSYRTDSQLQRAKMYNGSLPTHTSLNDELSWDDMVSAFNLGNPDIGDLSWLDDVPCVPDEVTVRQASDVMDCNDGHHSGNITHSSSV